jgi:hypothetical protein
MRREEEPAQSGLGALPFSPVRAFQLARSLQNSSPPPWGKVYPYTEKIAILSARVNSES